jgi:spore coat polysaccharide biosynthesis protein SpsF (cytidylyltransferase family)
MVDLSTTSIVQARMASSRLPGKVLLDIAGQPMLVRVVERARRARRVSQTVVATTLDASDDPVERLCEERGYPCFRGSAHDVLDRYYQAARQFGAQIVVRITADCPVIDPVLIDEVVVALLGEEVMSGQWAVDSGQELSSFQPSLACFAAGKAGDRDHRPQGVEGRRDRRENYI